MPNPPPLAYGEVYHIYNRGNNGENLFHEKRNYPFFLQRYADYVEPVAETYAYCLLRNHFHVLVRTRTPQEQEAYHQQRSEDASPFRLLSPSRQFARFFSAYALAINAATGRTGSLFEHPFHRKRVASETYCQRLVTYIDRNAQHHGFVDDFRDWPYASYRTLLSSSPTRLHRDLVLDWFGGPKAFAAAHEMDQDTAELQEYLLE